MEDHSSPRLSIFSLNDSFATEKSEAFSKLSILMPLFNNCWNLAEAVQRIMTSDVDLELELIAVDDGSSDGSWELLQKLAATDSRIKAIRHSENQGRASAIRTAISQMTGDVAVIQDVDLEYDPENYSELLHPIMEGKADAVFASRYIGFSRQILPFRESLSGHFLTFFSNLLNNMNLSDSTSGHKMIRSDVLKRLRLTSNGPVLDSEIISRLAQWNARICEIPVGHSYQAREENKKVRFPEVIKNMVEIFRARFLDPQFTDHSGFYTLASVAKAKKYNRWILDQVKPYLGKRLLEAGSGIGNLSSLIVERERAVLLDYDPLYISMLQQKYKHRSNVRVEQGDLTDPRYLSSLREEKLDTIFCSNVLEHLAPDQQVLQSFHDALVPGGHCVIVVPAGDWLYTGMDEELGHVCRYHVNTLRSKMEAAGMNVVFAKQFSKLGSIGWAISGHVLRRRHLRPSNMIWFDRLLPVAKLVDKILPIPGMSLIMVGQRPLSVPQKRLAA